MVSAELCIASDNKAHEDVMKNQMNFEMVTTRFQSMAAKTALSQGLEDIY